MPWIPWRTADRGGIRQLSTAAGLREIVDAAPTTLMLLDERALIVHRSTGAQRSLQRQMQAAIASAVEEQGGTATEISVAIAEMVTNAQSTARTGAGVNDLAAVVADSADQLSRGVAR